MVNAPPAKKKIERELEYLKNVRRPQIIARIAAARELGDLSENADYQAAKEEQAFVEGRIRELERQLQREKQMRETQPKGEGVSLGSKVTCQAEDSRTPEVFEIVQPSESDPAAGKISIESPIGQALLGHLPGDVVDVETPDGVTTFKILKIE